MKARSFAVLLAATVLVLTPWSASASEPKPPEYLVPWTSGPEPDDLSSSAIPKEYQTVGPHEELAQGLLDLQVSYPELGIAGFEWDAQSSSVTVFATAPESNVQTVLKTMGMSDSVTYAAAEYSAAEMSEIVREVVGVDGVLPSGHPVVLAAPSLDGSSISLTLDESYAARGIGVVVPDVKPRIDVDYGPSATPATRNHGPGSTSTTNYRYAGAYMHDGVGACSTGYRGVRLSDSRPVMLSAEHCSHPRPTGTQWYYSSLSSHLMGQAQGQILGAGYRPDLASWSGAGVDPLFPAVFVGDHTVPGSTLHAVKGISGAVVGSRICYSGSRSGTVCGNVVDNTNTTACYGAAYGCYDHLVMTTQEYGTPALGQGDSGGPVYVSSGGVYAAGFISGLVNGTTTCTGDAGGRLCSAIGLYAPMVDAIAAGYGISYIP